MNTFCGISHWLTGLWLYPVCFILTNNNELEFKKKKKATILVYLLAFCCLCPCSRHYVVRGPEKTPYEGIYMLHVEVLYFSTNL